MSWLRPALVLTVLAFLFFGLAIPTLFVGLARVVSPRTAEGSLLRDASGRIVGSELIGQRFTRPEYFHPRPSAVNYDARVSGATNLGPTSRKLVEGQGDFPGVRQLAEEYRRINGLGPDVILPADAVTRSASGLDPHISVENARLQAARVARARGVALEEVEAAIRRATEPRFLGILGEPRVHVLRLNLDLDRRAPTRRRP